MITGFGETLAEFGPMPSSFGEHVLGAPTDQLGEGGGVQTYWCPTLTR